MQLFLVPILIVLAQVATPSPFVPRSHVSAPMCRSGPRSLPYTPPPPTQLPDSQEVKSGTLWNPPDGKDLGSKGPFDLGTHRNLYINFGLGTGLPSAKYPWFYSTLQVSWEQHRPIDLDALGDILIDGLTLVVPPFVGGGQGREDALYMLYDVEWVFEPRPPLPDPLQVRVRMGKETVTFQHSLPQTAPALDLVDPSTGNVMGLRGTVGLGSALQSTIQSLDEDGIKSVEVTFDANGDGDILDAGEAVAAARTTAVRYQANFPNISGPTGKRLLIAVSTDGEGMSNTTSMQVDVVSHNASPMQ